MEKGYKELHCGASCTNKKSIFCSLSSQEMNDLEDVKHCVSYKKGEVIFHEKKQTNGVYCIEKGKIKLLQTGCEGKEQIIRFAQDGDVIGYRALLGEEPLSSSAIALEETSLCFVPKSQVLKLIANNSAFSLKILKLLSRELGEATKVITELAQKPVKQRLAEALLTLRKTFETDENEFIQIKLSREEMANVVGTATESVIRLLSDFKKEKLIEVQGRDIKIINTKELTKVANIYK